ncbi:MAG: hypothetical protein ACOVNP_07740 [Flavobacterium sp.]
MDYFLLDARAGELAVLNDGKLETEDNGRYILLVGSLKECCKEANKRDYGEHCVVSDKDYNILWELYNDHGHWSYKQFKKK